MKHAMIPRWRPITSRLPRGRLLWPVWLLWFCHFQLPVPAAVAQTLPPPQGTTSGLPAPTALPAASSAALPAVSGLPSAAAFSAAPGLVGTSHPPAPTMLQALTSAQRGFCARVRVSPVGQMLASMRKPLSVATGGLVAAEKTPHPDEQAQPGPEGTAAQLKAVNLQAPKRRAAVKQLQGLDVRYHPEAEAILIAALRVDPSECVRYEAAVTLTTLPVCTEPIRKALQTCVESSSRDGNPAELSDRVRTQASIALSKCECCLTEPAIESAPRPEYPTSDLGPAGRDKPNVAPESVASRGHAAFNTASWRAPSTGESDGMVESTPAIAASTKQVSSPEKIPASRPRPSNLLDVFKAASDPQAD